MRDLLSRLELVERQQQEAALRAYDEWVSGLTLEELLAELARLKPGKHGSYQDELADCYKTRRERFDEPFFDE